jgi:hypothetical protein
MTHPWPVAGLTTLENAVAVYRLKKIFRSCWCSLSRNSAFGAGDRNGLVTVSCAIIQARSTAEYATTLPIALMLTNAIPIATATLIVNCVMLLRMAIPIHWVRHLGYGRAAMISRFRATGLWRPSLGAQSLLPSAAHNRRMAGCIYLGLQDRIDARLDLADAVQPRHGRLSTRVVKLGDRIRCFGGTTSGY